METPKEYVLLNNVSTPIFFSGVIFCIFLIYSAALFSMYSFPIHNYKFKNISLVFFAEFASSKTPKPNNFFHKTEGNSNHSYIQRASEAWEQEENKNKNTPQKDKTSHKS